ncbi:alpha/beta hydrolase family protein [Trujillonella endophytica]|uniref:Alpha/beta hydrolase family protein n=1 Tax=Trujillonella endophytica TaxID=673521 RepID=A0A1H8PCC3_9ACTN|nr:alpha/beta fold hydrolase [Trujillella endophytica]SEO39585.1 Alpha/beta hydrolase family protein [Trujillella endophytica]
MTPGVAYGPHPDQFLELFLPDGASPAPVVVVVHGGFWRAAYGVEPARPLAADLAAAGFAAVAVEYRRVGAGGGWPETVQDLADALDALPGLEEAGRLDLSDVTVVGHSAGGHLAAWAAARPLLPPGAPGAGPRVRVAAAVLQAGVLDLERAAEQDLGRGAVRNLLGGPPTPDVAALASPVRLLPTGAEVLCVHGTEDDVVPPEQSERYVQAATRAGDRAELRLVPGDHMSLVDPEGPAWGLVREWLRSRAARAAAGATLDP